MMSLVQQRRIERRSVEDRQGAACYVHPRLEKTGAESMSVVVFDHKRVADACRAHRQEVSAKASGCRKLPASTEDGDPRDDRAKQREYERNDSSGVRHGIAQLL